MSKARKYDCLTQQVMMRRPQTILYGWSQKVNECQLHGLKPQTQLREVWRGQIKKKKKKQYAKQKNLNIIFQTIRSDSKA